MLKKFFIVAMLFASGFSLANACDFTFRVNGNKTMCRAGDVLEVTVDLSLTHRVCNVAPAQTKFKIDGIKVIGASQWKQIGPTRYERTIKMQVLPDNKKHITLMASRSCSKEGGQGVFTLPKK